MQVQGGTRADTGPVLVGAGTRAVPQWDLSGLVPASCICILMAVSPLPSDDISVSARYLHVSNTLCTQPRGLATATLHGSP